MIAADFSMTALTAWAVAQLQARAVFRGLKVIPDHKGSLLDEMDKAVAALGTVAVVGNAEGDNKDDKSLSLRAGAKIEIYLGESDVVNQNRTLAATVATDAARRAVSAISVGQKVRQTGASQDFMIGEAWDYFLAAADPTLAASWSPVWNIYQLTELVMRVLHGSQPAPGATLVYDQHKFGVPFPALSVSPDKTSGVSFRVALDFAPFIIP